jgi:hypothetical protein
MTNFHKMTTFLVLSALTLVPRVAGQTSGQNASPTIAPESFDFGSHEIGTKSGPLEITVTNPTSSSIKFVLTVDKSDYQFSGCENAVDKGASCVVQITFSPTCAGDRSSSLQIAYLDGTSGSGSKNLPVKLKGTGTQELLGELCSASTIVEVAIMLTLCLLYWLATVMIRWNRIARPTREMLKAEIASLQTEIELLAAKSATDPSKLKLLLTKAGDLIDVSSDDANKVSGSRSETKIKPRGQFLNFLFWSRGQEMTGWGYVHEVEIQMSGFLPDPTVTARLETAEQQLRITNDAPSLALANSIHQGLTSADTTLERKRALLAEALSANYEREDNTFADLVSWQNKTAWLVACGLALMIVLSAVIPHHSILFVIGSAGGLLSRLSRSLNRKDVPTDYGASWTTLFLSPVAGGLGAWAGILISTLAVQLHVLGSVFEANWLEPSCRPMTLAIALVFGFSERLLDGVLDKLVDKADSAQTTATNPQPPQSTTNNPNANGAPKSPGDAQAPTATPDQELIGGKVGTVYSDQLQASGINAGATWMPQSGSSLPTGLVLSSDGRISGVPTVSGLFSFIAEASFQGTKQTKRITVTIDP